MTPKVQSFLRFSITAVVVMIAALIAMAMWRHYMYSPGTREGRLRAEVVRVAPDVSGPVSAVAVRDNQLVKRGDVLYQIDPATYDATVDSAEATLAKAQANEQSARLKAQRYAELVKVKAISSQDYDDAQASWKQQVAEIAAQRLSCGPRRPDPPRTPPEPGPAGRRGRVLRSPRILGAITRQSPGQSRARNSVPLA